MCGALFVTRASNGARRYRDALEKGITLVARGQGTFKDMSGLYPTLRVARCEHHYIFCLPRENAPSLIVAILHERMNLMERLKERIGL